MEKFTPKEYLKIDIANSFGLDKLTWQERLAWFDQYENQLLKLLKEAGEPALFYAGIKAWEASKQGTPIGYPISLDATSSGIQILSVLTGDRNAALLSNVLDAGKRNDAYTEVYRYMQDKAGSSVQLDREPVKKAVMTAFFGSKKVPEQVFGEGPLLGLFHQTLEELCPFCWELNKALLDLWNPTALIHSWIMPDGFHVHIKVMDNVEETVQFLGEGHPVYRKENVPVEKGRSLSANLTHSVDGMVVRELTRRCSYDPRHIEEIRKLLDFGTGAVSPCEEATEMTLKLWELYQKSGFLSARILDYLNYETIHLVDQEAIRELVDSLPAKPFSLISVHDCFRVHPNYGNDLRKQYNLQLSLIAQSDMLQHLLSQMLGYDIPIRKIADFSREILDSNYALS